MTQLLELASHCWSGPDVPIYHHLLKLQLSSLFYNLIHFKQNSAFKYTVFYCPDDTKTVEVIDFFRKPFKEANGHINKVIYNPVPLPLDQILRRAIGRHQVATTTIADVVWFTDCDYLLYCNFDKVIEQVYKYNADLYWPCRTNRSREHKDGDDLIAMVAASNKLYFTPDEIDFNKFGVHEEIKAIGGTQICKGQFLNIKGYATAPRRIRPVHPRRGFQRCWGDATFSRSIPSKRKQAISVDNVFRIRHSRCGRDKGTKDHSIEA